MYQEESKISKGSTLALKVFMGTLVLAAVYTVYRSWDLGQVLWLEFFVEILAAIVLAKQKVGSYTYVLGTDSLAIEERALFRVRHWEVPYSMIDGLYAFDQKAPNGLEFSYQERKASAGDAQSVSALVYSYQENGKLHHGRILMKVSPVFLEKLAAHVPQRIGCDQALVETYAKARAKAFQEGITIDEALDPFKQ